MDSGTFYGPKIRSQRFLRDAIDFAETREGDVDIVITGPPGGGDDSDIEQLDDDTLVDVEGMPEEVAGEVDVMYEESDEDTTAYQVSRKKQKLSVPKWKQSHITPQVDLQNDNSVVTLCSNAIGLEPIRPVKRRVKDKGSVNVPQPNVVACYNAGMGGVDLMDRSLADYRPTILGKKWYWTLVVNAINIAVVFSWRVYQLCYISLNQSREQTHDLDLHFQFLQM
ncbi:piggyBac transposable element-derived protein 3-like [Portunus trituberculatus]|uniref:piggyBac transposable element-derived protein 3-like n=1 Tax=Portunus trituberculatus TaxID=210409 RepID=UPI001E1CB8DC|nr:piggyBac transposable element-derived protein 3-like [Portunus trituberculatus]XP_045121334.1 piggyBac transposable element-derived protein 3-like [Portunus trituberculatus]XP_045135092.1 piggyBac transposable element-derived protein 3-like [Portunus trituberculatus]